MSETFSTDVNYLLEIFNRNPIDVVSMKLSYDDQEIQGQTLFNREITLSRPKINMNQHGQTSILTLIMIDPDAPNADQPRTGPFLHWILTNIHDSLDGAVGDEICDYRAPGPGAGSGMHRYIHLLYESDLAINESRRFHEIEQRRRFPLQDFVKVHQLRLVSMRYFIIQA